MGKKSREKRERRLLVQGRPKKGLHEPAAGALLQDLQAFRERATRDNDFERAFGVQVAATRDVLRCYRRMDIARALCISDLWPANVASGVKHVFAMAIMLGLEDDAPGSQPITSHAEFTDFLNGLYAAWPAFPTLEDFSPEADWGQTRISLDDVPAVGHFTFTPSSLFFERPLLAGNVSRTARREAALRRSAYVLGERRSMRCNLYGP